MDLLVTVGLVVAAPVVLAAVLLLNLTAVAFPDGAVPRVLARLQGGRPGRIRACLFWGAEFRPASDI